MKWCVYGRENLLKRGRGWFLDDSIEDSQKVRVVEKRRAVVRFTR